MMNRLLNGLRRFMYGRYGTDALNNAIMVVWVVLAIINLFVGSGILYGVYSALGVWYLFRMLSRNIARRSMENQKFLQLVSGLRRKLDRQKSHAADPAHKYITCKACGANLRVRREAGKHTVKCPKCGGKFEIRIF